MPSITLTYDADQANRIRAALSATPYPQNAAGFKALLTDYIKAWVKGYEDNKTRQDALATVVLPTDLVVS